MLPRKWTMMFALSGVALCSLLALGSPCAADDTRPVVSHAVYRVSDATHSTPVQLVQWRAWYGPPRYAYRPYYRPYYSGPYVYRPRYYGYAPGVYGGYSGYGYPAYAWGRPYVGAYW